jgi:UDP-glucuronate 4-epimerase
MLEDTARLNELLAEASADIVIHMAAQPGVRYSATAPQSYVSSNIVGTFNLVEALRDRPCRHLLIASTSAVYGTNPDQPFTEAHSSDYPVSLYAATKKSTEVLAYNFAHQSGTATTVMRLFTVYGPWGRPDMAIFKFTDLISRGQPIEVYGAGKMTRDFTYVDDVVEAIRRLVDVPPAPSAATVAPYRIVNIGAGKPAGLEEFIAIIEEAVGRKALRRDLPIQPGEVPATWANVALLERLTGYKPETSLRAGVSAFVKWYRDHQQA